MGRPRSRDCGHLSRWWGETDQHAIHASEHLIQRQVSDQSPSIGGELDRQYCRNVPGKAIAFRRWRACCFRARQDDRLNTARSMPKVEGKAAARRGGWQPLASGHCLHGDHISIRNPP
jgi:hypothetical protein